MQFVRMRGATQFAEQSEIWRWVSYENDNVESWTSVSCVFGFAGLRSKESTVEVTQQDFLDAISEMKPSVSSDDMKYFKNLQRELSSNNNSVIANWRKIQGYGQWTLRIVCKLLRNNKNPCPKYF